MCFLQHQVEFHQNELNAVGIQHHNNVMMRVKNISSKIKMLNKMDLCHTNDCFVALVFLLKPKIMVCSSG